MTSSRLRRAQSSFLARWGAVTVALCLMQLVLALALPDAALRLPDATTGMKLALVGQEWLALAVLALLPSLPRRQAISAIGALIVVVILASGWVAFVTTDRFPGVAGAQFLLTVPTQAFEHLLHIRAVLLLVLPVAMLGGTLLLTLIAQRAGQHTVLAGIAVVLLVASAGTNLIVTRATNHNHRELFDARTGVSYSPAVFWASAERDRAGPASTLLRSAVASLGSRTPAATGDPRVPVILVDSKPGPIVQVGPPSHHWNVLIVEIESMRADVLRSWGATQNVMPTVEAIAADGRRYRNGYTTATQTDLASGVPLSGEYPLRTPDAAPFPAVLNYPREMLYDLLHPLGWRAAIYSSQNEAWWGMINLLRSPALDTLFHAENYDGHTSVNKEDMGFWRFVNRAKHSGKIDDHDTITEALRWLAADERAPFLLYVNLQTSHVPYTTPDSTPRRFGTAPSFSIRFGAFPEDSISVVRDQYRNALAYIDDQIARLRAALVADGRWDSTIVIVTGDHGEAFFEHDVAAHANSLWQEEVHVPLVMKAPSLQAGDDDRPASHVDIAPTVADLLGLPSQPVWQGVSLLSDSAGPGRPRFFMVQSPLADQIGVVSGRWKLVLNNSTHSERLTDLAADPMERNDVAGVHPLEADHLAALARSWRAAQLRYYQSEVLPLTSYPPRIEMPRVWAIEPPPAAVQAHR